MARNVEDWVDSFEQLTQYSGAPARLRRWAAIAGVAGALERKVWVHTAGSNLYPNLFVFLVSPPGVGKSRVMNAIYQMWQELTDHRTAPSSVSKASLIDELQDAHRVIIRPGITATSEFHSLKILSSELGVLLPEFANDFMNTLTDLYDGYPYGERRRTKNLNISIPKPQLNMLAGTTPDYLSALLPEGAWEQGFLSRVILAYGADVTLMSMFASQGVDQDLQKRLQKDLETIGKLYGEIKFTQEAAEMIDGWYLGGQAPKPEHPKLKNYSTRRPAHLLKLCQVACVCDSDHLVIDVPHVQRAMDWLFDAETFMPDIFKSMTSGGDGKVMDECWHFLFQYKARFKKPCPHSLVLRFLSQKVPTHNVERLLDMMEKAGMVRALAVKGEGMTYEAKEKGLL